LTTIFSCQSRSYLNAGLLLYSTLHRGAASVAAAAGAAAAGAALAGVAVAAAALRRRLEPAGTRLAGGGGDDHGGGGGGGLHVRGHLAAAASGAALAAGAAPAVAAAASHADPCVDHEQELALKKVWCFLLLVLCFACDEEWRGRGGV